MTKYDIDEDIAMRYLLREREFEQMDRESRKLRRGLVVGFLLVLPFWALVLFLWLR